MQDFRKSQEPAVDELKEPIFDEITATLRKRYGLNFTRQDTSSLWFLCKQVITIRSCTFYFVTEEFYPLMSVNYSLSLSLFLLFFSFLHCVIMFYNLAGSILTGHN